MHSANIYGPSKPYITGDERKLSELDFKEIVGLLQSIQFEKHFCVVETRIIPDRFGFLNKAGRLLLALLRPFVRSLAGRVLFSTRIEKSQEKVAIAA